ncbi:peptidase C1B, bleomycin hydrolase [Sistotremastrum suecicum HHB10207 ss-3]|uniref:Cysteine proteinase 1, mitochondrial n=1 Tax=Sistotremastrum suecicum HHB10207 ss-3 TaxID=1314776 RepID=A0A166E0D1_9AGAM|nr:peptidase C1B, bleomycin hydrolase [Sistotremastrum suecicum HHB10207 ss-3]
MGSASSRASVADTSSEKRVDDARTETETISSLRNLNITDKPASQDGSLTLSQLDNWESSVAQDPKLLLARTILTHSDITSTLLKIRQATVSDPHVFNTSVEFKTNPITSQKSSGRCWLFATTNVVRYSVMKKLGLKEFQLSQSYLFFYDKLEKANYYLELSIEHADKPLDDRKVVHFADAPVNDGGQWDMAVNLLATYGVVPQSVYPESFSSSSSRPLDKLVTLKLREHALILRDLSSKLHSTSSLSSEAITSLLRKKKEELLAEVWNIMSVTLGKPPGPDDTFVWDYETADGKVKRWEGTPKDFYKDFSSQTYPPTESFSLINDPRNSYGKLYTVEGLGNIWGGRPVLYVNAEVDKLKEVVVKNIKAGQPVFFGCDVGQFSDRQAGIMDTELYDYENAFNITLNLTKAQRLQVGESLMTHAMVISAVHIDPRSGKPVRYKVENSWGDDVGDKGWFVMSDKWFDEFVYQVVTPRVFAPKNLVDVFDKGDKVVLPPWDPMGSLA